MKNSTNLSKMRREELKAQLELIKSKTDDIETILRINAVEYALDDVKYGISFEEHEECVNLMLKKNIPILEEDIDKRILKSDNGSNFIIEGDNLHSLKILESTHKERIDVIYIDPPYNTGARDWKYNNDYVEAKDEYRHSKWLSMMNSRLKIAKELLKNDGVMIVAIDENELATLSLLLDQIFGVEYKIDTICIVHNPRGVQGDNFSYINEYALFVYKKGLKVIEDKDIPVEEIEWSQFRNWGDESERHDAANCFYPIFVKNGEIIGCGEVPDDSFHPRQTEFDPSTGVYSIYPIDNGGVERKWRYATQSFESIKHLLRVKQDVKNGYQIEIGKDFESYRTVWMDKKYDANEYGTKLINNMVPSNDFSFPKSLYNTYDCLFAVLKNKPNAIVLDFFAGSGTTGHAVLMLNKQLGGNRHFILCTNNDIGDKKEKEFKKQYPECLTSEKEIDENCDQFKEWKEKYGIATSITYPRIVSAINGYKAKKADKTLIFEKKLSYATLINEKKYKKIIDEINNVIEINKPDFSKFKKTLDGDVIKIYGINDKDSFVEGLGGNVSFLRAKYIDKYSNDDDLENKLFENISAITNLYSMYITNDDDWIIDDEKLEFLLSCDNIKKKLFYVSPFVLLGEQDKRKLEKMGIKLINPVEKFYYSELREAGEK